MTASSVKFSPRLCRAALSKLTLVVLESIAGDLSVHAFIQGNPGVAIIEDLVSLYRGIVAGSVQHNAVLGIPVNLIPFQRKDSGTFQKRSEKTRNREKLEIRVPAINPGISILLTRRQFIPTGWWHVM